MGTWQRYQDKDVSRDVLTCYGYGDGGGGPTEEMLEESRRLEGSVAECPAVRQTHVKEFFHLLEERLDRDRLSVWSGELYLEYHRGTYTSMAKNKKYNRLCEFLNGETEKWSVLAGLLDASYRYPGKELEKNWKLLLLNQFHDILPGSSVKEVYEDSDRQYRELIESDTALMDEARKTILACLGLNGQRTPEVRRKMRLLGTAALQSVWLCLIRSASPEPGLWRLGNAGRVTV